MNGVVVSIFKNNTVLTTAALTMGITLPCYGASGYGDLSWKSTLPHMSGYHSTDSVSPHYSLQYNGNVVTLTVHSYSNTATDRDPSGSLTCYSDEAGLDSGVSVTIHIANGPASTVPGRYESYITIIIFL